MAEEKKTTKRSPKKTGKMEKGTSKKAPKKASPKKVAAKKKLPADPAVGIQKLRIRVRAYEHKVLDVSIRQIMDTALRYDAEVVGPVPLPTENKRYTVNRSSFIFKDAREQFEMRVHKRLIDILSPSPKVIEALTNINLPSGVNIDVKMI